VHQPLPLPPARLYALLKDQPFEFEPGQSWRYSNTNYYLLGLVIEKVSGRSMRTFLRDEVLARAGLTHTRYCDNEPIIAGRTEGYEPDGPRLKKRAADRHVGAVRRRRALLDGGGSGRVVAGARGRQGRLARVVRQDDDAGEDRRRQGPAVRLRPRPRDRNGHSRVGHNGGINGFTSTLVSFPEDGVIVTVLANTMGSIPPP